MRVSSTTFCDLLAAWLDFVSSTVPLKFPEKKIDVEAASRWEKMDALPGEEVTLA